MPKERVVLQLNYARIKKYTEKRFPVEGASCSFKAAVKFPKQDEGASLFEHPVRVLAPSVLGISQGKPKAFKVSKSFFAYFLCDKK